MSPEQRLLRLLRPLPAPPPEAAPAWKALLAAAERHRLLPLLHQRLRETVPAPPADVSARLRAAHTECAAHQAILGAELARLTSGFDRAEIPLIVFKGLPLARALYDDPTLRPSGDIDLIVRREDQERATTLIQNLGWEPGYRYQIHTDFRKRSGGLEVVLELHWNSQRAGEFQLPEPLLWAGSEPATHRFARETELLTLMLHTGRHAFLPYRDVVDVAWAIHRWQGQIDWARFDRLADRVGARPLVALLCALCARDLGVPLPPLPALVRAARGRRTRLALRLLPTRRLLGPRRAASLDRYLILLLIGAWRPALLAAADLVRTPEQMAYIYRLRDRRHLIPLAYLARPILLLRKYLRRLVRS